MQIHQKCLEGSSESLDPSLCASLPNINKSAKHISAAGLVVSPDLLFLLLPNPLTSLGIPRYKQ